jgi:peptide/nickel transport system permease protein
LLEQVRRDMGLDQPLYVQYLSYMGNLLRGDMGESLFNDQPVLDQILAALPYTLTLALSALLISTVLGVSLGIVSALKHNTWIDTIVDGHCLARRVDAGLLAGAAVDPDLLSHLEVVSADGTGEPGSARAASVDAGSAEFGDAGPPGAQQHAGRFERRLYPHGPRQRAAQERDCHPPRAAQCTDSGGYGHGPPVRRADQRRGHHRNDLARIGLGRMYVESILNKDITMIQGLTLVLAFMIMLINIVVDLSYAALDPRIRYE